MITADLSLRPLAAEPEVGALNWRNAIWLILGCAAVRLVYLAWLTPYELVGDEAYYWVQSQHLDWSYREKGPLLAWLIAAATAVFGNTAWAVRLPMVLASVGSAWAAGRLTLAVTKGDQRAAFLAVAAFVLIPAFQANAQICTQDGPLILLILAMTAAGLRLIRRWEAGLGTWREWLVLWFVLGLGVILKQSVLLFGSALVAYMAIRRKQLSWHPRLILQQLAGIGVFAITISPILFWEHRHGWPMLGHTLGHLGFSGDRPDWEVKGSRLSWLGNTLGGLVGAIGPAALGLMVWASVSAYRRRREDASAWADRLWLICAAWPSVIFFVVLSVVKPVVPSWPLPSTVPLIVLVGWLAADQWDAVKQWRNSRNSAAVIASKGTRWFAACWTVLLIYGIGGWLVVSFPTVITRVPGLSQRVQVKVLQRIAAGKDRAQMMVEVLSTVHTIDGRPPVIVATHYQRASLYTFYLPAGHPVVTCAGEYTSARSSNFDTWDETRLDGLALRGRSLLLVGSSAKRWGELFVFDHVEQISPGRPESDYFLATNYQGPRPGHSARLGTQTEEEP